MAWSVPTTRSSGYTVTATNWNELVNDFAFLSRVNVTTFSADVSITATAVGSANQIVSSGAISYQNAPHLIEFWAVRYTAPSVATNFILRDGTTVIGTITQTTASQNVMPFYFEYELTPTAASHTYNVAAWNASAGTGTVKAGSGGTAGDTSTFLQGMIRITRVPT